MYNEPFLILALGDRRMPVFDLFPHSIFVRVIILAYMRIIQTKKLYLIQLRKVTNLANHDVDIQQWSIQDGLRNLRGRLIADRLQRKKIGFQFLYGSDIRSG